MTPRIQLALNVPDLDEAVRFYGLLFDAQPAKRRPGYANFAIAEPPLKLVLIESDAAERLNHLGIEVGSTDEVVAARGRIADAGIEARDEDGVTCCWASQDKVWVTDPAGAPWEVYTVLADAEVESGSEAGPDAGSCGCDDAACTVEATAS